MNETQQTLESANINKTADLSTDTDYAANGVLLAPHHPFYASPEEEAADEALWQQEFKDNRDILKLLAREALEEDRQGKTLSLEDTFPGI